MNSLQTPFRYDYVGSFLRPQNLKQARADFADGKITREELTAIEDEAIRNLVAKQKELGYHVITDGEFRRATWHLDFMWGFNGVGHSPTKAGLPFHDEAAMIDDTYLTGKVSVDTHPFVEHFEFVKALEDEHTVAKQTIPAPAQFLEQMILPFAMPNTSKYYPDTEELVQDIANGYRKVIRELYEAGCRNLQLDDCSWGMCVDPNAPRIFGTDEAGLQKVMEQLLRINNLAIEGKPEDMVINTHVCRGNFHSTYASSGAYDRVPKPCSPEKMSTHISWNLTTRALAALNRSKRFPGIKKSCWALLPQNLPSWSTSPLLLAASTKRPSMSHWSACV